MCRDGEVVPEHDDPLCAKIGNLTFVVVIRNLIFAGSPYLSLQLIKEKVCHVLWGSDAVKRLLSYQVTR